MPENMFKSKNKRFRTVNLEECSFSELSFICDRLSLDTKKSVFLKKLIHECFEIMSTYRENSAVLLFDGTMNKLILTSSGDSVLECGIRPVEPITAEIEKNAKPIIKIIPEKKAKPIISKFPAKVKTID